MYTYRPDGTVQIIARSSAIRGPFRYLTVKFQVILCSPHINPFSYSLRTSCAHPHISLTSYVFLKYELETDCPATILNIVSPAPKYESAIRLIDESGIWSVAGLAC